MVAGADSIDDLALLRHGVMSRLFSRIYAPSTLGSFLRAFRFGHVRQLDAIAARFLAGLVEHTSLLAVDGSATAVGTMRSSMSMTPSCRSMVTPSRGPGSATARSAV